jgi:hypothetical protein
MRKCALVPNCHHPTACLLCLEAQFIVPDWGIKLTVWDRVVVPAVRHAGYIDWAGRYTTTLCRIVDCIPLVRDYEFSPCSMIKYGRPPDLICIHNAEMQRAFFRLRPILLHPRIGVLALFYCAVPRAGLLCIYIYKYTV